MKNKLPIADCRLPVEKPEGARRWFQIVNRESKIADGFTLVELLVVISIIAVLAAFIIPALSSVKRHQYITHAQVEMGQLKAAIDSYHSAYGFYPPGNGTNGLVNQLYYELEGTTNNNSAYITLDGSASINVSDVPNAFSGAGGFVNCSKPGSAEDSRAAQNFIHELSPRQTATVSNSPPTFGFTVLVSAVGGPDPTYMPLKASGVNPWRYVSPGVNNPTSYDLWIQLRISGKTYLVCNWSKEVQVNNNTWQ